MELSRREKRRLRLEKLRQESHESQQEHEQKIANQPAVQIRSKTKYYVWTVISVAVLAILSFSVYSFTRPGPYDNFAKCLSEKGAVMYGAMDWCKFTQAQKGMFGKSFRYIDYHDFEELDGIKKTPTWVINGQWFENVQSFDNLAKATGCSY